MRSIHIAQMDKPRPVLVLSAHARRSSLRNVTVATITTTVRGAVSEIQVGPHNGLDNPCVVNCDDVYTIPKRALGRWVGMLNDDQERHLTEALHNAFDLEDL